MIEGLNNKARVILKRSYGLKGADSLWTRLILDVNRATRSAGRVSCGDARGRAANLFGTGVCLGTMSRAGRTWFLLCSGAPRTRIS